MIIKVTFQKKLNMISTYAFNAAQNGNKCFRWTKKLMKTTPNVFTYKYKRLRRRKEQNNNPCDQKCKRIKAFILLSTLTLVKSLSLEIYFLSSPVVS